MKPINFMEKVWCLEFLNLLSTFTCSFKLFFRLLCRLPKLSEVNLSHCTHIQDESVSIIAQRLPALRKFNIDGIAHINDG